MHKQGVIMADKGPVTIRSRKFIRNALLARRQMVSGGEWEFVVGERGSFVSLERLPVYLYECEC